MPKHTFIHTLRPDVFFCSEATADIYTNKARMALSWTGGILFKPATK